MIWARVLTEKKKYLYNVNRYLLLPIKKMKVVSEKKRTSVLIWLIPLLILLSCKENQDVLLSHVWVSDLGTGKLVLKKGEVSFYGKQGTFSSKKK